MHKLIFRCIQLIILCMKMQNNNEQLEVKLGQGNWVKWAWGSWFCVFRQGLNPCWMLHLFVFSQQFCECLRWRFNSGISLFGPNNFNFNSSSLLNGNSFISMCMQTLHKFIILFPKQHLGTHAHVGLLIALILLLSLVLKGTCSLHLNCLI